MRPDAFRFSPMQQDIFRCILMQSDAERCSQMQLLVEEEAIFHLNRIRKMELNI